MTLKRILRGGWRLFRRYTFIKLNIFVCIVIYLLREFFLGFENANNYLKRLGQAQIIPILRLRGANIGQGCNIQSGITLHNCKNYKNLKIGDNCHIGKNCFLDLRDEIIIGNNVVIAMNNTLLTHTDMSNSELSQVFPAVQKKVRIKDNVYLGSNCTVLMGVTIHEKAIVGACSLVNKDVALMNIVAGNPASKIKSVDGV